jgi:hypothetical protein
MQDFDSLAGEKVSIASLLPEVPGAQPLNSIKIILSNARHSTLCPHCAALALFSLQLNAPSGGKGYRTGLRGGGPLTTLIELQDIGESGSRRYGASCGSTCCRRPRLCRYLPYDEPFSRGLLRRAPANKPAPSLPRSR